MSEQDQTLEEAYFYFSLHEFIALTTKYGVDFVAKELIKSYPEWTKTFCEVVNSQRSTCRVLM